MKILPIVICFTLFCCIGVAAAAEPAIGVVKNVTGEAFVIRDKVRMPLKVKDQVMEKDTIITGICGSIGIILQDNSSMAIGPNTRIVISKFLFKPENKDSSFTAQVKKGTLVYLSGLIAKVNKSGVKFETSTVSCGIRGSHALIKVDNHGMWDRFMDEMDIFYFPILQ